MVAHPDDEALWFSSILHEVDTIIFCFQPGVNKSQETLKNIIADYPFPNVHFLSLQSFFAYHRINFILPIKTSFGLMIKNSIPGAVRYFKNYLALKKRINSLIPSNSQVFTHNPWGEYGHEEHVQVSTILAGLQKEKNLTLWYPNYGSTKSFSLIKKTLFTSQFESVTFPIDHDFAQSMKSFYLDKKSWTWRPDWQWFESETFFSLNNWAELPKYKHTIPLNLFHLTY